MFFVISWFFGKTGVLFYCMQSVLLVVMQTDFGEVALEALAQVVLVGVKCECDFFSDMKQEGLV